VLNVGITGARRFAADDYSLSRIKAIGKAASTSLNDVVLAMCSGALRRYLIDQNALPDRPLIAMVPVSLRPKGEAVEIGKNAVGSVLCSLATHLDDPAERLQTISASMNETKARLASLDPTQITLYSVAMTGGIMTAPLQIRTSIPPVYNLVISNVPGPRMPLYLNGAKLQGLYPVSIPQDSQALNITVLSYVDQLAFGLIGCRTALPHLQRLLDHLTTELDDLEKITLG
jgi:WS/DGAT/MGAT family acyltransferase